MAEEDVSDDAGVGASLGPSTPQDERKGASGDPSIRSPERAARGDREGCGAPERKRRGPNWGGRRPGVGAPKGNPNGFKHGRRSRQLGEAVMIMAANPKLRDTLVALANRAGLKQAKSEEIAARLVVNAITKGVKIENPEHARAIIGLLRNMTRR